MRCPALRHALSALLIAVAAGMTGIVPDKARAEEGRRWVAGNYSFSDELGGFTITGISGRGTREDPVVIEEELQSASPVTLVIRAEGIVPSYAFGDDSGFGFTYFRIITLNNSGLAWVEFEFELQEIRGQPSMFGDGLSFDQRRMDGDSIHSDAFERFSRDFEPYDRLRFIQGKVDPLKSAAFTFLVTDFTPRSQFYIVQDPRIPSS